MKEPGLRADLLGANGAAVLTDATEFDALEARIRAAWRV